MFFYNGPQSANQRVERLAGIGFLWPEGITNLCFCQLMGIRTEEHLHQLLLHRRQLDTLTLYIVESTISLCIAQSTVLQHTSELHDILSTTIETESSPQQRHNPQKHGWALVGQAENGGLRTAGISLELTSMGIDSSGCLTTQLCYLQVTVE